MSLRCSAILLALLASSAHAGGFGIPEIGVRRTGMASIVGRPDDPSSIYHNPAGLVLEPGWNLYVSMGLAALSTEFSLAPWARSNQLLGAQPGPDGYYAPVKPTRAFGVIPMIALTGEILPGKLYLGAAAFIGNAQGAAFSRDAVTHYHLIDGYVVAPQAVLAAAYRISPSLSLGATAGVINIRVHGERYVFPIVNGADVSQLTGTTPQLKLDGSGWAPTWMIGAFGHPVPRITWGATITGRIDATLKGPVEVKYSDDARSPDTLEGAQTTNQLLPWAFSAGANFDLTPQLELGSEFRYWLYRQYQNQHTDIVGIFLVRSLDTEKDYHDSWESSGGLRIHDLQAAPRLELMLGSQYDHSPAPPQTITLDSPSFSHVGLHTGVRYTIGRYRVGASYIHYWYDVPTISNSITSPPTNISGHGGNNIFTLSLEANL